MGPELVVPPASSTGIEMDNNIKNDLTTIPIIKIGDDLSNSEEENQEIQSKVSQVPQIDDGETVTTDITAKNVEDNASVNSNNTTNIEASENHDLATTGNNTSVYASVEEETAD